MEKKEGMLEELARNADGICVRMVRNGEAQKLHGYLKKEILIMEPHLNRKRRLYYFIYQEQRVSVGHMKWLWRMERCQ